MIYHSKTIVFFITIAALLISLAQTLVAVRSGAEIKDLYSLSGTCFNTEASTWSAPNKFGANVYTVCSGTGLVGGYNVLKAKNDYITKTFSTLPTHTMIYYTITIWALDTWEISEHDRFDIKFDSTTVNGFEFSGQTFNEDLCGAGYNDLRNIRVFGKIGHTASSLTLQLIHNLNQASTDESFGFREVNLIFSNGSSASSMCGRGPYSGFTGECSCPEGQYLSGSSCTNCHANCESCFGPTASDCYQCRLGSSFISGACTNCTLGCAVCHGTTDTDCDACLSGYTLFNSTSCVDSCDSPLVLNTAGCVDTCSSPCTSDKFVFWDGTCSTTCDAPLQSGFLNKFVKSCDYPCPVSSYLYWDGSCSTFCYNPLNQTTFKNKLLCDFPCADNEFLYWNGTCNTQCVLPLVQNFTKGKMFCKYPCNSTDFLYFNGSCIANCSAPFKTRFENGYYYCDYPCYSTQFLYWDGSCESDCPAPYTMRTEGTRIRNFCDFLGNSSSQYLYLNGSYSTTCVYPFTVSTYKGIKMCKMSCAPTEYAYWNGSCLATCPSPFTSVNVMGVLYCNFPCANSNHYLYWDGNCSSTCPFPLDQRTEGAPMSRKFCDFRCNPTDILYWNGSCGTSCPSPYLLSSQNSRSFCRYPCTYTQFLYYNGSCIDNCPYPFIIKQVNGLSSCIYPCSSTEYIFWNGSCIPSCPAPLKPSYGSTIERWCDLPCSSPLEYYYMDTGLCSRTCDAQARVEGSLFPRCLPPVPYRGPEGFLDLLLTASAKPNEPTLIVLNRYTQYVRYLNISLPSRLDKLSASRARSIISFKMAVQMPDSLQKSFIKKPLPLNLEKAGFHSSFLVNYWGDLICLLVSAFLAGVFQLLEIACRRANKEGAQAFFENLRKITTWNLCFILIGFNADDITYYVGINVKTLSLDSATANFSIFASVIAVLFVVALLALNLYVIIRFRAFRKQAIQNQGNDDCKEFDKKWERFYTLYRGYNDNSRIRQSFYIIYILRMVIPQALAIVFIEKPSLQAIVQIVVNALMVLFILIMAPLKKKINHIQLVIFEVTALVSNCATLYLTYVPATTDGLVQSTRTRAFLGDMIILGSVVINLVTVVFLVVKFVLTFAEIYQYTKKHQNSSKTVWLRLLVVPLQQAAFGFEEVMEDLNVAPGQEKAKKSSIRSSKVLPEPQKPGDSYALNERKSIHEASPLVQGKQSEAEDLESSPETNEKSSFRKKKKASHGLTLKTNKKELNLKDNSESPQFQSDDGSSTNSPISKFDFNMNSQPSPTQKIGLLKSESQSHNFEFDGKNRSGSPNQRSMSRLESMKLMKNKINMS